MSTFELIYQGIASESDETRAQVAHLLKTHGRVPPDRVETIITSVNYSLTQGGSLPALESLQAEFLKAGARVTIVEHAALELQLDEEPVAHEPPATVSPTPAQTSTALEVSFEIESDNDSVIPTEIIERNRRAVAEATPAPRNDDLALGPAPEGLGLKDTLVISHDESPPPDAPRKAAAKASQESVSLNIAPEEQPIPTQPRSAPTQTVSAPLDTPKAVEEVKPLAQARRDDIEPAIDQQTGEPIDAKPAVIAPLPDSPKRKMKRIARRLPWSYIAPVCGGILVLVAANWTYENIFTVTTEEPVPEIVKIAAKKRAEKAAQEEIAALAVKPTTQWQVAESVEGPTVGLPSSLIKWSLHGSDVVPELLELSVSTPELPPPSSAEILSGNYPVWMRRLELDSLPLSNADGTLRGSGTARVYITHQDVQRRFVAKVDVSGKLDLDAKKVVLTIYITNRTKDIAPAPVFTLEPLKPGEYDLTLAFSTEGALIYSAPDVAAAPEP